MRAVDKRAGELMHEYVVKARNTDRQFCGTAAGDTGPVETKLGTMGNVEGISWGPSAGGHRRGVGAAPRPHPPPRPLQGEGGRAPGGEEGPGEEGGGRVGHHNQLPETHHLRLRGEESGLDPSESAGSAGARGGGGSQAARVRKRVGEALLQPEEGRGPLCSTGEGSGEEGPLPHLGSTFRSTTCFAAHVAYSFLNNIME